MDEVQSQINQLRSELSAIIAKVDLLNPALFLEFKGTIIETLRVFDRDIEEMSSNIKDNITKDEKAHKDLDKEVQRISNELLVFKTKAAIYGTIAGSAATLLVNYLLPLLFK